MPDNKFVPGLIVVSLATYNKGIELRVSAYLQTRQEAVNGVSVGLQAKEREAVVIPLPVSMHAGQIFLLTKLLTATDLHFYDFEAGVPAERWRSGPSGSS